MPVDDPYDLGRFAEAQSGHFERALSEIRAGRKRTHWMWYVFPQFRGLGCSPNSLLYAIGSLAEAQAYLLHPVLGPRLKECCEAVIGVDGRSAFAMFGSPDDSKLQSCATLFGQVSPPGSVFHQLLAKYYAGLPDQRTLDLIAVAAAPPPTDAAGPARS